MKAFITRDFNDAGTETRFSANTVPEIEAGAFANYQAAGLVREATAEDIKAANKANQAAASAA